MTYSLSLGGCQIFTFTPNQFGVNVQRRALNGRTNRWQVTGTFEIGRQEARSLWAGMVKDGAIRI